MIRIAVVCFCNPLARKMVGGIRDVVSRINVVKTLENCCIDVYFLFDKNEMICGHFMNDNVRFYGVLMSSKVQYVLSRYPLSVRKRYDHNLASVMKKQGIYDAVIYEGTHMILYRLKEVINAKMHVVRVHGIESEYREQLSASSKNIFIKILQRIESIKYRYIENNNFSVFDKYLFVSEYEYKMSLGRYPELKGKMFWMPPALEMDKTRQAQTTICQKKLLYYGDLSLTYNIEGILWFVRKVYPTILVNEPDVKLDIIGNCDKKTKKSLQGNSIEVHGYVDDLNRYIKEADILVFPIFHGAGVKIKLIEAISHGKIVVATGKATEGTDLIHDKHLLIVNNADKYAESILNVLANKEQYSKLGDEAFRKARSVYSMDAQKRLFETLIREVTQYPIAP